MRKSNKHLPQTLFQGLPVIEHVKVSALRVRERAAKEKWRSSNQELNTIRQELFDYNEELNQTRKFAEATISILHEPLLVLDKNYCIKSANKSFYKNFKLTESQTLGKVLFELHNNGWNIPGLRKKLVKIQEEKEKMIEAEITFIFPVIGERTICFNIQSINRESGEQLILLALDDITIRIEAQILEEKAIDLFKERQVLHSFFMQTPALLSILKGPEHIFTLANPLFCKFIGNRNPIGKKISEVLPELEGQGFFKILNTVYRTGMPFSGKGMPALIERKNGKAEQTFIDINFKAFNDAQGNIEGILVFAYDVTEQIIGRKHLEQSAEMFKNLYLNAPAFMCKFRGPEYIHELVNPEYQKIFGTRKISGRKMIDALPELKGTRIIELLDNVYKTGIPYVATEMLVYLSRDEGKTIVPNYFNFSYQPLYNIKKEIDGILLFGYEVTKQVINRKQGEKNLRLILESIPQITITASADGNITFVNHYFLEYSGLTSGKAMNAYEWKHIIHPADLKRIIKTRQHSLATAEDFYSEIRLRRKSDGNYRWHIARAKAIKDSKEKIIFWVGALTDINDQKIKEQQKDEFLSIASHEMKTPLTVAKACLQMLELSIDENDESTNIFTKRAILSVNKFNDLITTLLDLSKIHNGKLDYNITTFNFNDMINDTIEKIQNSSPIYSIIKTGKVQSKVTGDKDRLGQVFINLLNNAIKYSPNTKEVFVNIEQYHAEIKVSVKDNGIGIVKENIEKIFQKFYRVEGHPIQFQGLGIGLFISYEIIEHHKGKLWVESEHGKGSSFYFTLPASRI